MILSTSTSPLKFAAQISNQVRSVHALVSCWRSSMEVQHSNVSTAAICVLQYSLPCSRKQRILGAQKDRCNHCDFRCRMRLCSNFQGLGVAKFRSLRLKTVTVDDQTCHRSGQRAQLLRIQKLTRTLQRMSYE